nr:arylamine N-acetyltransferase [Kitasatospora sp. SID7827]
MDEALVDAYLERIGAERPARPDLRALAELQERHVLSVPFENLDYHLDREIHLDARVVDKIVRDGRGGACYEVNPAFGLLLEALGYRVRILAARVRRPDGLGAPLGHLLLRVDVDGVGHLVDVGFRRVSRRPLPLDTTAPQPDAEGVFAVTEPFDGEQDLLLDGAPLYRVDLRERDLGQFRPSLWWFRTSPDSPFLHDLFCSLPTADGRVTLKGTRLTLRTADGQRTVEELDGDEAVRDAYLTHFGIALARLPRIPVLPAGSSGIQVE